MLQESQEETIRTMLRSKRAKSTSLEEITILIINEMERDRQRWIALESSKVELEGKV